MKTFTPGPWTISGSTAFKNQIGFGEKRDSAMIPVGCVYGDTSAEYCKANANLCAAAPELFALACQYASECSECGGTGLVTKSYGGDGYGGRCAALADADDQPCPECADIRAVIAKATGEQP